MSKISTIAATALSVAAAFAAAPSASAEPMTGITEEQAATAVCLSFNAYGPVQAVSTVSDGIGDWIVWVRDKDGDLWLCNASAEGNVYANTLIKGDLARGAGERVLALMPVAAQISPEREAIDRAERLCKAAGRKFDATTIVATVEDGLGDYVVWMQAGDNSYWLCNASADAQLYAFQRIHSPLNAGSTVAAGFRAA